ncbi:MAG: hypothetical protein AAF653_06675, partial [Chloroflexota bacterium]
FVRVEQEDGLMTRIDFWFIARKMMSFAPLTPNIVEDRIFPRLMGYPWHLTNEVRASQEIALLEGDGMLVEMILWDSDEQLPLEVGFLTARPGATHFLFIATQHNYPHSPPDIYTLPFASIQPDEDLYDLMERIWTHAELVEDPDDWEWNTGKTLLEYIYVAENMLGWNTSELPTTPEGELEAENVADSPAPVTEPDADTDTDNEKDSEADSA